MNIEEKEAFSQFCQKTTWNFEWSKQRDHWTVILDKVFVLSKDLLMEVQHPGLLHPHYILSCTLLNYFARYRNDAFRSECNVYLHNVHLDRCTKQFHRALLRFLRDPKQLTTLQAQRAKS